MDGVPNRALGHLVRVALGCYRALVAFGSCWLPLPEDQVRRIVYGEVEEPGPEAAGTTPPDATTPAPGPGPAPLPAPGPASWPARRPARWTSPVPASRTPGPPPGHPERLRFDVPLSELEARLARELRGV
ncbi:DUF6059 family protein [Streptomyces sp. NPDC056169]|uniref:DUF6059 family protein n=1 Tax=Streptomyces sp. NPDC056169 TaxID=3345734 RepID=UPI0035E129C1